MQVSGLVASYVLMSPPAQAVVKSAYITHIKIHTVVPRQPAYYKKEVVG